MYDSEGVLSALLIELHSVCQEWAGNLPLMTAPVDKVDLSIFAIKNTRRKMEDRHALCVDVNALYGLKVLTHATHVYCTLPVYRTILTKPTTLYLMATLEWKRPLMLQLLYSLTL